MDVIRASHACALLRIPNPRSHLAEEQCEEQEPRRHHGNLPSTRGDGTWLAFHFAPLHFLSSSPQPRSSCGACAVHIALKANKARGRRTHTSVLFLLLLLPTNTIRTRAHTPRTTYTRFVVCAREPAAGNSNRALATSELGGGERFSKKI